MIKKITLLSSFNQYETKRYFTQKLEEALKRKGFEVSIVDSGTQGKKLSAEEIQLLIDPKKVDLTCSFGMLWPDHQGRYLWQMSGIPHWFMLLDSIFSCRHLFSQKHLLMSCVDHQDYEFAKASGFENIFFWPHAVEKDLSYEKNQKRPYDVVFIGSCFDPDSIRAHYQKEMPKKLASVIDDAVDIVLGDNKTSLLSSLKQALIHQGIDLNEVNLDRLFYYVDYYMRGKDRLELIRSIHDVNIHIFGDKGWNKEVQHDWSYYLKDFPNITLHPPVSYAESLEILKQSKISLNSVPSFKTGIHERILSPLACGALPITTDTLGAREVFIPDREILLYQPFHWGDINSKVHEILQEEEKRKDMVSQGRKKVMQNHTWDVRVEQFMQVIPEMWNKIVNNFSK